jgi:hypothetical protein
MLESENEWKKLEQVPISLPRVSRNFLNVKTRNEKNFYNWISKIIPLIHFGKQMNRTFFIVIQLCYNKLWPFSH